MYYFLTVENQKLTVLIGQADYKTRPRKVVESLEELRTFFIEQEKETGINRDEFTVMSSSSLDFPEDYTDDPDVIAMCHELN